MAFTNTNDFITGRRRLPTPSGGEVFAVRFTLDGDRRPGAEHDRPDRHSAGRMRPG
jgi:hypothetical protein